MEAVTATGASRLATLLYGIVPQVKPAILGLEWARVGLIILVVLAVVLLSEAVSAFVRSRVT